MKNFDEELLMLLEKRAHYSIEKLVSSVPEHLRSQYHVSAMSDRAIQKSLGNWSAGDRERNAEKQRDCLSSVDEFESLFLRYAEEWGDSRELRLLTLFISREVLYVEHHEFEKCVELISGILNTNAPPALLFAGARLTKGCFVTSNLVNSSKEERQVVFEIWLRGVQAACSQLDLESILNAPVELFEEFLREPVIMEHTRSYGDI